MKIQKIVFITESMEKGVGKHIIDLYSNLKKNSKFKIFVLYGTDRVDKKFEKKIAKNDRIELKYLHRKIGIDDIKSIYEIKKILKNIQPDVVHCHSSKAGLSGRIAAKLNKAPKIIYSPHAYFFLKFEEGTFKRKVFILVEKFLSKFFTNITITTSIGEDKVFKKYKIDNENKKILIEHGIEVPVFSLKDKEDERKKIGINEDQILIGAMARFEEQKDPVGTFNIMQEISKKNEKIKCIFWGKGSEFEKVKQMNEKENNIIILPGETTTPDKSLNSLDIYLTASLYEGLPYTLLESMAIGLPIVASDVEGNRDCVYECENGILFEVKKYEDAVNKTLKMIEEGKYLKYGKKSLEIFNKRFSIKKMLENYERLYLGEIDE